MRAGSTPFVCLVNPFICHEATVCEPFVAVYTPSVVSIGIHRGFTIVELIITLVIGGVLLGIAVPQFTQIIQNQRISSQANELITDLSFARSEAIKRAANVGVCAGNGASGCTGAWTAGRVVFLDADNGGDWDANETILRERGTLEGSNTLAAISGGGTLIVFTPSGAITPASAAGTYAICHAGVAAKGKRIVINGLGQSSVSTSAPSSC